MRRPVPRLLGLDGHVCRRCADTIDEDVAGWYAQVDRATRGHLVAHAFEVPR